MSLAPETLNAALQAYIRVTIPQPADLLEHIDKHQLAPFSEEITATLHGLTESTYRFLYDYPGGVPPTEEFRAELRSMLQQTYPWLDAESITRIVSYSGWISWHEGLFKT
ncbi:MAG: hypothetical protein ACO1TE_16565 [Prosthecobacter sp.]